MRVRHEAGPRAVSGGTCSRLLGATLLAFSLVLVPAARAHAAIFFVDRSNPSCTDTGNGTLSAPFCTITAAVARGGPGVTIYVKPGVYRERVVIPVSGAPDAPFVIEAVPTFAPVVVDGSDDYGSLARWVPHSGNVWLAGSVTVAPKQVFVDGARLAVSTVSPELLPPSSFRFVAGSGLYVNVGGGNPGARQTLVGARTNGFRVTGRSWVEIRNFEITRCDEKGIYVLQGSQFVRLFGNHVSQCVSNGIGISGSTDVVIESNRTWDNLDHGISMLANVTRSLIKGNESFRNARPNTRAATGIYLFDCPDNRIEGNRTHHNQDSGIELADTSNSNVSLQNLSWSNGDHGFDHVRAVGTVHVGDVAWGNFKDGFSIEGSSTNTSVLDCIASQNGTTTNEYDLYVDRLSAAGFVSASNIFWSPATRIHVNGALYSGVDAWSAATGADTTSLGADPLFVDPAGGNFELRAGSPAIDSGDSSVPFWPHADMAGRPRVDVVAVANTGRGPVPYADRGALEHVPPIVPPLLVAPSTVTVNEGATVTINVQATNPSGQPIVYLAADLGQLPAGNDATFTTAANLSSGTLVWHPTYSDSGTYRVTFMASTPATSMSVTTIRVVNVDRAPVIVATPPSAEVAALTPVRIDLAVSDPDGDAITSLVADYSTLPAGNNAAFTTNSSSTAGTFTWTPASSNGRKNFRITFTARNARSTSLDVTIKIRPNSTSGEIVAADPIEFAIGGISPNPARGAVSFAVAMPAAGALDWSIVDLQGRVLWSEMRDLDAGHHRLVWNGDTTRGAIAPGIYYARIRSPFERGARTLRFVYLE